MKRISEELKLVYILALCHKNKIKVGKEHRDKAVSLLFAQGKPGARWYLEIILGGTKRRRWRIKPTA
jgi:hypothetical protein